MKNRSTQINMPTKNEAATAVADRYVARYKKLPSATLARKMYRENKLAFSSLNSALCAIRYRRGAMGVSHRKREGRSAVLETPPSKYSPTNPLGLPPSDEKPWVPFVFDGADKVLNISDLHIPYHNVPALTCALQDGLKDEVDGLLINGDALDFHQLSRFVKDPSARRFKEEMNTGRALFSRFRELFPKARIVFKRGNHDDRFWTYLAERLPEIFDDDAVKDALSLGALLGLDKLGIEEVGEKREVMLGKLPVLHGHEFRQGFAPPVNPARGAYLKAKECVMVSHHHRTSEHTETTLGRSIVTTWSIGCLCELRPQYDPFNGWNHGHAIVEIARGGDFHVQNKRQLDGRIL